MCQGWKNIGILQVGGLSGASIKLAISYPQIPGIQKTLRLNKLIPSYYYNFYRIFSKVIFLFPRIKWHHDLVYEMST